MIIRSLTRLNACRHDINLIKSLLSQSGRLSCISQHNCYYHLSPCRYEKENALEPHNPRLDVYRDNASRWWNGKEFELLRAMNQIRVPFITDGIGMPMNEAKILDVGCGGGILSEPLARLGAHVTGIDPVFESINQARLHAQTDEEIKDRLKYLHCKIEDISSSFEHHEQYDAVVASEVLEHINDIEGCLIHLTKTLKPGGSLFITTINQTNLAWLGVIFFGEYVLKQLPRGTHDYNLFVNLNGLKVMLERMGYHIRLVNGFMYEPFSERFLWTKPKLTHYALQAMKPTKPDTGPQTEEKGPNATKTKSKASSAANMNNYQQKRFAPRGKRPKRPLDDEEMEQVLPVAEYRSKLNDIIKDFQSNLELRLSTRTGSNAFETLKIPIEGLDEPLELRDIAQLSMKGNNLIVINLSSMPEAIKPTVSVIRDMGSVEPQVEGSFIFIPVPRVTREQREKLVQAAKHQSNQVKDTLKTLFNDHSKKAKLVKGVSQDLIHQTIENLRFDLDSRLEEVDVLLKKRTDLLLLNQGKK